MGSGNRKPDRAPDPRDRFLYRNGRCRSAALSGTRSLRPVYVGKHDASARKVESHKDAERTLPQDYLRGYQQDSLQLMNNVLRMSRKTLTGAVVATTIAWSIGLSALVAPLAVKAAPASGSLVKASLPAVYFVGGDGKRYVFPNEKTYKTWYADFSSVMTITDAELAALPIGGNVTYKPGVRMIKITSLPKVYAVSKGGALHWVTSEAVAVALYGANWNKMIDDVPDWAWVNYVESSDINSASDFNASSESSIASINTDKNLGSSAVVSGSLSASLSMTSPSATTLPRAATGVVLAKLDVRNGGSSSAVVDSLTVRRTGPGAAADFSAVYVYNDNARLTTGRTINSTTNEASFSGLNLSLAAGESKSLSVVGDVAAAPGAGNVNAFSVVALSAGTSAASGLPLAGPNFTMSSATAGTVTITKSGATPLSNVKLGGMAQKIGEFQVAVGAAEDVRLAKIALYQAGAVSKSSLSNLTLKQAGLTIASVAGYDAKDRATFVLAAPMLLEKGTTRTFEVYADVAANARVGATETILSYVDQAADVLAVGQTYGVGVGVDIGTSGTYNGTSCALGAGNCSSTRIEGGQLTMTFNGPAVKDISVNGKDVEIYNFTMAAASNLEVRNLRMQINAGNVAGTTDGLIDTTPSATVANYSDIKVTDTASGAIVAGPLSLSTSGSDTLQALTFTEVFNLAPGQARTFKVTADVANNSAANFSGDTVSVDRLAFTAGDIRNLDNSTNIALTDIVPNTTSTGNAHSIKLPTLTASAGSTPVAQTFIMGSQGVALMGLGLKAGDASDIRVSSLTLQGQIDDDLATLDFVNGAETTPGTSTFNTVAGIVSTAKLMNGSTQLGDTKSPATSTAVGNGGDITFDNLNLLVPKGQTIALTLVVNLNGGLTGLADRVRFNGSAGSATDADGNSVSVSGIGSVTGPAMDIAAAGTLTLALAPDDTESEAGLVVGGASNAVLGKFKFTAQNEELKLTKLDATVDTAAGVSSLSLFDGSTLVAGPSNVSGSALASFTGINFVIPKDSSKVLTVKGNLNSVGATGATTGSSVRVGISSANFEVRGTSAGSSTLLTAPTTGAFPLAANAKVARKSKPTVSVVALPTTTLSGGDQVVLRFTVSADAASDIALGQLHATVTKSGSVVVAQPASATTKTLRRTGGDFLTLTSVTGTSDLVMVLATEETIAAGTSKTFEVYMNLTGAANGDSVSSSLLADAASSTGTLSGLSASNFVWSDMSIVGHGTGTADWASGYKVKSLPSDSQSLVK